MVESEEGLANSPAEDALVKESASEKMIPQSEVNKIIGGYKQKFIAQGYQKAKDELNMQQPAQQPPQPQITQPMQPQPAMQQQAAAPQQPPADLAALVQEEMRKQAQAQWEQQFNSARQQSWQVAQAKMADARAKYPDFDQTIANLNLNDPLYESVLHAANHLDNAGDVIYELAKNPVKAFNIGSMLDRSPHDGQVGRNELKKLSDSIKINQTAAQKPQPTEPLSQVKPQPIGAGSGEMSIADYKKQFLR